jgi:hypothetical protein
MAEGTMWEIEKETVDLFGLYNELWAIALSRGGSWRYRDEFSHEEIADILRLQDGATDTKAAINLCVEHDWLEISRVDDVDEPIPEIFYKVTEKGKTIYNALRH